MKLYTSTGDDGTTGLFGGDRVSKDDVRIDAYGAVDELNAALGLALVVCDQPVLKEHLAPIQSRLFDLGADLATPDKGEKLEWEPLRITPEQTKWLETQIDAMNTDIPPLDSFVLPAGTALSSHLHMARTISRRAERLIAQLAAKEGEIVSPAALAYANRLSDYFFVAARAANNNGAKDVKWVPGANR